MSKVRIRLMKNTLSRRDFARSGAIAAAALAAAPSDVFAPNSATRASRRFANSFRA